jgi:four helix bundle protein
VRVTVLTHASLVQRHRSLEAWQQCRALASEVYDATRGFPADERYGLVSQLRRAAVSAAANIAEGYARFGTREMAHALSISLGSLAELDTLFAIAADQGYLTREQLEILEDSRSRASRLTFGLARSLRRNA